MIYKDQLEAVYKLIENEDNWLKGRFDKGDDCFCLVGANRHRLYGKRWGEFDTRVKADNEFAGALGFKSQHGGDVREEAFFFNDSHTHAEVLALLQSAIERAPVRP